MTLTMTLTHLMGVCLLLLACTSAQNFADYDYQDTLGSSQPQSRPPQRVAPRPQQQQGPSRSSFNGFTTTTARPAPVAILKQINKHNDDGSYTYGYEGADGSFKIETKLPTGEVMGKYGYVDDTGKLRTVEYGANRYGFQPAGTGITVPPPTLVDETTCGPDSRDCDEEQQLQQQPQRPPPRPKSSSRPRPRPQPQPQQQFDYEDAYAAPVARPQQQQYQPQQQQYQPQQQQYSFGPAPPRAIVAGASPVPPRASIPGASPTPPRISVPGAAPAGPIFRSAPQPTAPQYRPSPPPASFPAPPAHHNPAPVRESPRPTSRGLNLDNLAQQYALPRGSSNPTHDISFGSYSSQTQF